MGLTKLAVGQAGGPTAVINASLVSFIKKLTGRKVFGILDGFQGLVENRLLAFDEDVFSRLDQYQLMPGAALGAGRYGMTGESIELCVKNLKARDIHELVMIGGNGTMLACKLLQQAAERLHYDLAVIGIPKTVDNDIFHTDHTPGFGSAARYVALSTRDNGFDLSAMRNFENVRIIETMGRNAGWLAAASGLLKSRLEDPPHLLYVPERPLSISSFLKDVEDVLQNMGYALVVISEGIKDERGKVFSEFTLNRGQNTQVLGGAGRFLAKQIKTQIGVPARAEMLGMNQRCLEIAVSPQDRREAIALGRKAADLIVSGEAAGKMLTLQRGKHAGTKGYQFEIGQCTLEKASVGERHLPDSFLKPDSASSLTMNKAYFQWLEPLVGDDLVRYPPALVQYSNMFSGRR